MITPSQQSQKPPRRDAVTAPLSPSQQAAREFWRQAGADGMPPFYVMSQYYAELSANSDNLPAATAAIEKLLTGLSYATDVDTVFSELNAGLGEELGYWAGRYCLFDSDGNRFDLVVGRGGATLTVPPALVDSASLPAGAADIASVTVLSGDGFSNGRLQFANAQFQAALSFALPFKEADFDSSASPAAMFQFTAPQCNGTFAVAGGGAASAQPVNVNGKRGSWTQAGVDQVADGDPAAAWYGQYVMLDVTDVTAVKQEPERVYIYDDPSFGLTFQWGQVYGSNLTYNNNVLQCADEGDDRTRYAMQFTAPHAGAVEINVAVTKQDVVRSYKGYWVGRYPSPRPAPQARLARRPVRAAYRDGSDPSVSGYSQPIDVSSLSPEVLNKVELPFGAVGNTYALWLNLIGCASSDRVWWVVSNDSTGRAAITPSGQRVLFSLADLSDSDVGQHLQVTVQLTRTSATPPVSYTLLFDITVIQCEAISIEPAVPPPVVIGTPYTQNLVADGACGNFSWSVIAASLPRGLTWYNSSHQLSGTVTDPSQAGKAFSLVLGLAASDVIMDPLMASLGITVQSAPAVASNMPSVENILLYSIGPSFVAIMAIAAFVEYRLKTRNGDANALAAIRAGNRNVENATAAHAKALSQSIVDAENARILILERNAPYDQSISREVIQQQEELVAKLDKTEAMMKKLREYLQGHQRDEWDGRVTDEDLLNAGYESYGEVVLGLNDLVKHHSDQLQELSSIMRRSNQLTTKNASDRIKVSEATISEVNNRSLLEI
jgi:hypothetical protein